MGATFQKRRLRFTFHLATGVFDKEGDPDKVELTDFRSQVEVMNSGGFDFANCRGRIYGIDQETMNRLTLIYDGITPGIESNVVTVEATDSNGAFSTVFQGEILHCSPVYNGAPDVHIEFSARAGIIGTLAPTYARSFPGPRLVSDIVAGLAKELGYSFENNGVNTFLIDQALAGTPMDMLYTVKEAANIDMYIDTTSNVISIAPKGQPRESDPIKVNKDTGLVGWPEKFAYYIEFMMLYTPDIHIGCKIEMDSDYPVCNGEWFINRSTLNLSCNMPGGPWFTEYAASKANILVS